MNGLQAARHVPSAVVDLLGATGGLYLYAGMKKTSQGIVKEDFPWQDVTRVLFCRLAIDMVYYRTLIPETTETVWTFVLWWLLPHLLRERGHERAPMGSQRSELMLWTVLCMLAFSRIVIKL
jgi:hypothetical protein